MTLPRDRYCQFTEVRLSFVCRYNESDEIGSFEFELFLEVHPATRRYFADNRMNLIYSGASNLSSPIPLGYTTARLSVAVVDLGYPSVY